MAAIFQDGGFSWDGKVWGNSGYVEVEVQNTLQTVSIYYYYFPGPRLSTLHYKKGRYFEFKMADGAMQYIKMSVKGSRINLKKT